MKIESLIQKLFDYLKDEFPPIEPAGLLCTRQAYGKFNPSAGHHLVDPVIKEKASYPIRKFSVLERCLREADSSRIGLSNRHLSFFEMLVWTYYGEDRFLPIEKSIENFYFLLVNKLGLNKEKFLITILKECIFENLTISLEETLKIYKVWSELFGKEKIKLTTGRRNFFLSRQPNAVGGAGAEIYYQLSNGKYIEIGSQLHYHFIYYGKNNLQKTINGNFGNGLGLERLLMILEDKTSIYDISLIRPLKEIIIQVLGDRTEILYEDTINLIADHIRAISFVIWEKERSKVELTDSQRKILKKFKKNLSNALIYFGISPEIYKELVEMVIEIYKKRFPDFFTYKDKILEYLSS